MAVNPVRYIAPFIKVNFKITSKWWTVRENPVTHVTQIHRGLDIATSGKKNVYSILTGVVHSLGTDSSRGNWIIIWDNREESPTYGYASLYMHLDQKPLLIVGQALNMGDYVGLEGTTGQSTGVHLHVEMQDISRWNFQWHSSYIKEDYLDPTEYMGIDNIKDTWWYYDGELPPEPPVPTDDEKKPTKRYPWVLYARRLRRKRNL